jgi:hypothetical protein
MRDVLRLRNTDIEAVVFAIEAIDFDLCQILRRQQFCQRLNKYNIILIWFLSHFIPFRVDWAPDAFPYMGTSDKVEEDPYLRPAKTRFQKFKGQPIFVFAGQRVNILLQFFLF